MRAQEFPLKINIGCGYDKRSGFLNVDVDPACNPDVLLKDHDLTELPQGHFEEVLAWDVFEHIPRDLASGALLDWASLLKVGGTLTLQTSSVLGIAKLMEANNTFEFQYNWSRCLFGNQQHPGDFHYNGFTEKPMMVHLVAAGFENPTFTLNDGWLLYTQVKKTGRWSELFSRMERMSGLDFLELTYNSVLGRPLDDTGRAYLLPKLESGFRHYGVLRRIIGCPEHLYKTARNLGV